MFIQVTDTAFSRIKLLNDLQNRKDLVLRIVVDGGGCAGFSYKYSLDSNKNITSDDCIITGLYDMKVVIDSVSQTFMEGCIVDFIKELGNEYFKISNPNAKSKCGCGNSFSI